MFIKKIRKQKKLNEMRKVLKAAVLAMGVGTLIGYITAPKSGQDLRGDISDNADKAVKKAKKTAIKVKEFAMKKEDQLEDEFEDMAEKVKDELEDKLDDVSELTDDVK
ncbi:MAG: YtxH domain-containing protein, partial [Acidaminobacteraceae bacterium]